MKKSLNPLHQEIAKWANQMRTVDFPDPDNSLDSEFFGKAEHKCIKFVYPMPRHNGFRVAMSILGIEHNLGYFDSGQAAARFADMCLVRFHHLRRGKDIPLTNNDLNFCLKQVEWDTEDINQAVIFLDAIAESHLFQPGHDKPMVRPSTGEQSNSPTGESAAGASATGLSAEQGLMLLDCVGDLSRKIDDLTKEVKLLTALTTAPR